MSEYRVLFLLWLKLKSVYRKFFYNAGLELVSFLCGGIIVSLFYYISKDFFDKKLVDSSFEIRSMIYTTFYFLVCLFGAKFITETLPKFKQTKNNWTNFFLHLGELKANALMVSYFSIFLKIVVIVSLLNRLSASKYNLLSFWWSIAIPCILILFLILLKIFFPTFHLIITQISKKTEIRWNSPSLYYAMVQWRLKQLYRNNFSQLFYLILVCLMFILIGYLKFINIDSNLLGLCAIVQGFFISSPLFHQLKTDLEESWFEKNSPISHRNIYKCYQMLGLLHSIFFSLLNLSLIYFLGNFFTEVNISSITELIQIFILTNLCVLLAPALFFQIDPRKPTIQLIICFLCGLFIGTLVLIMPLTAFAIPILVYYAAKYQTNRFYRA